MLKYEMIEILNKQINEEMNSAYLYLAMSMRCKVINFEGAAQWFMVQYQEELAHAQKIWEYLNLHGADVILDAIAAPNSSQNSLLELFESTLEHEQHITQCIYGLIVASRQHIDFATELFLQWFLNEQVEEEANDSDIIAKLKLIGAEGSALYLFDKELGQRLFTPPV